MVTKISLLLILSFSLYAEEFSYENIIKVSSYKFYDIDVNKDGIKDKVAYNLYGNELLFFIKDKDKYKNVYIGDNFSADGIYVITNINDSKDPNFILSISTIFGGSGGQTIEYFISYEKNEWFLSKFIKINSYSLLDESEVTEICEWYKFNDKEECKIINVK